MIKAITVYQPWASLIAIGAKTVETRSWSTVYRGPLAIHAAKKVVPNDDPYYCSVLSAAGLAHDALPYGAIVAICRLADCWQITSANCPCYPEFAFGDYRPGRFAWKLADIRRLAPPVPATGRRGLWNVNVLPV